uniref:Uncharacterized protein n=1 Tax=Glossina morsitans morsitans TaxID=37546 RepID=A0A1B0FMB4_GLOMM
MVMLQSPTKSANGTPTLADGQMSPNSNPDSPKSNTSPEVSKCATSDNAATQVSINSPTTKIPKFIITQQTPNINGNHNTALNSASVSVKTNEDSFRYSMERLKQLTDAQRLSPATEDSETESNLNGNSNLCRRSQTPPINSQIFPQSRKLLELTTARPLARPEPLQHPHAVLLQQHPHLLQNPQFLAAAAAQHHAHQHVAAFHQHLPAAAFHIRGSLSTTSSNTMSQQPSTAANTTGSHYTLSPSSSTSSSITSLPSTQIHHQSQQQQHPHQHHHQQPDMNLEKFKLVAQAQAAVARSSAVALTNSSVRPDLSDYGFRIQLGGLAAAAAAAAATSRQIAAANYARSDTSEELNVDGNDEDSHDESQGTPT